MLFKRRSKDLWPKWKELLSDSFSPFDKLTKLEQKVFLEKVSVLYFEKSWDENLNDKERLLICARGSLPLIHRSTNYYPNINNISTDQDGFLWYRELKKQFEVEEGKIVDKSFRDNFCQACHDYFYSHKEAKSLYPQQYKNLDKFFTNE
tara:strand:+ start:1526 stop:1972 length:447 start_codon:yes stop_codon:yes gene_type:complete